MRACVMPRLRQLRSLQGLECMRHNAQRHRLSAPLTFAHCPSGVSTHLSAHCSQRVWSGLHCRQPPPLQSMSSSVTRHGAAVAPAAPAAAGQCEPVESQHGRCDRLGTRMFPIVTCRDKCQAKNKHRCDARYRRRHPRLSRALQAVPKKLSHPTPQFVGADGPGGSSGCLHDALAEHPPPPSCAGAL